jgi:DNA-binding CsgD family transcriptional regulator
MELLDGLESLVEKSLLRRRETVDGQPWYRMLETVREFALERLEESGEASVVHRRQVLHAMQFAVMAEREVYGPDQTTWFVRLEQEHDNLRTALRWSEAQGYAEPCYRLAGALWWFWLAHGHVSEGRERIASALERFPAREGEHKRNGLRAQVLYGAGVMAAVQGDHEVGCALHAEALALRRQLDSPEDLVRSLQGLGVANNLKGDAAVARGYLEEALAIARDLGDPRIYSAVLHDLGNVLYDLGNLSSATAYIEEGVSILRRVATDPRQLASAILTQAIFLQEQGEYAASGGLATEALDLYQEVGDRRSEALALAQLGGIALASGDLTMARERLAESIAIHCELGDAGGTAFVLDRFMSLAVEQGRYAGALRLAGAAAALRQAAGTPLPTTGQVRLDGVLEPARRALGVTNENEALRQVGALTLEQAMNEALEITSPRLECEEPALAEVSVGPLELLTPREREVAALIAKGWTNRQIARELVITEGTAASHVVHIFNKLAMTSRAQVAVWAAEHGLVGTSPAGH